MTRKQLIDELAMTICGSTGIYSYEAAGRILSQVANAQVWPKPTDDDDSVIKAMAFIREMAPKNVTEAMLAGQMIATHEAALMLVWRSTLAGQSSEAVDANVLRATRLLRLNIQQIEAMQKLKGKAGQQNLTVEQVNVHQGGQAIVGAVSTSGEGG
jgi:hypothetical protein